MKKQLPKSELKQVKGGYFFALIAMDMAKRYVEAERRGDKETMELIMKGFPAFIEKEVTNPGVRKTYLEIFKSSIEFWRKKPALNRY